MACLDLAWPMTTLLVAFLIVMGSNSTHGLLVVWTYSYYHNHPQSPRSIKINHAVPLVVGSWSSKRTLKSTAHHEEDKDSSISPVTERRQKKNKYATFSKIGNETADPFEVLLQESERKNRELIEQQQRDLELRQKRSRPQPEIKPLPKLEFPDTQTIDPYDPQTFGYVELGSVLGAHGVHGWLKVRASLGAVLPAPAPATTSAGATVSWQSRLCSPGVRHIKPANKRAPRRVILLQGRHRQADEYLVQLGDVHDRDSAQKLRGATLYIREEQQREEDSENTDKTTVDEKEEYFVQDLVGLEVYLTGTKQFVGTVRGVVFAEEICSVPGLGHDYLELLLPRGVGGTASWKDELVLVPLVPQNVPHVDITNGEIYLDPPVGLLDLTYIRQEKTRIKGFLPSSSDQSQ